LRLAVESPRAAIALASLAGATGLSVLLFFVSARFRLPLAALATVLAAGALASPRLWQAWSTRVQAGAAISAAIAAALTFSRFDGVADRKTFVEDHALLARAAIRLDDPRTAWPEAMAALTLNPNHPDARLVAVAAYFNLLVQGEANPAHEPRWHDACSALLATPINNEAADLRAIAAIALWRSGDRSAAINEWERLGAMPSAIAARLLAGDRSILPQSLDRIPPSATEEPLVRLARLYFAPAQSTPANDDQVQAQSIVARVFRSAARRPAP
jgi:hypothetical protein